MIELIISLSPLFFIMIIIVLVIFYQQISIEKRLDNLYSKYGEKIEVTILHSKYSIFNSSSHNYFFTVSFKDIHGKNHIYSISTANKSAKNYLNKKSMEVFCLSNIFSEYNNIVEYSKENSKNSKEFRKNLDLYSMPLMIILEDREFRKVGNLKRKHFCLIFLFILIFILIYVALIERGIINDQFITSLSKYLIPCLAIFLPVFILICTVAQNNKNK